MKRRAVDNQKNHMVVINTWLFAVGSVLVFFHWYQGIASKNVSLLQAVSELTMNDGILLSTVAIMIGGLFYSIIILRPDVAKRQREKELLKLAMEATKHTDYTDPETGLYNQKYFEITLKSYLDEFDMTQEVLGVFIVDINNDTYSRTKNIKETASEILSMFRDYDVIARTGTRRFAIITPHLNSEDVKIIQERFTKQLRNSLPAEASFTIGTTSNEHQQNSVEKLIAAAEYNAELHRRLKLAA
jgi:diguanylate cyclase (GGDEF)-like protein